MTFPYRGGSSEYDLRSSLRRYDFYQTATHLILSLYSKGYGSPGVKELVEVEFKDDSVGGLFHYTPTSLY